MPSLYDATLPELEAAVTATGEPAYRARQVREWAFRRFARSYDEMTNVPAALRRRLEAELPFPEAAQVREVAADDGLTRKRLLRLADGTLIETVLMLYDPRSDSRGRATVCVSSQAGCAMGCVFCATGQGGFERNLSCGEILAQVLGFAREQADAGAQPLTNVVFMGMGEPLLNLDPVLAAAEALTDRSRFGLGGRHLTLSTSGVVPAMRRLVALAPPWTLAVSLHAARPALRAVLVPLERRYPLAEVVAAADAYAAATGRRVSYEFVMIDGINDTEEDARAAAALLRGRLAHVNLIPMNPVAHTSWRPSPPARIAAFAAAVRVAGIAVTVRRNRGIDIGAACGQLAAEQAGAPSQAAVARRRAALERDSAAALALGAAG